MDQNIFGIREYFKEILKKRFPFAMLGLIIILLACFELESVINATNHPSLLSPWFNVSREALTNGHIMRLVTANFFHVNAGQDFMEAWVYSFLSTRMILVNGLFPHLLSGCSI